MFSLLIVAFIIFTPIAIFGPEIFIFFFGKKWYNSGVYSQLLLPWLVVKFIGSPITTCVNITGKQKTFFYLTLIFNVLYPFSFYIFLANNISLTKSLFIISFVSAIYYLLIILWIRHFLLYERNKNY